MDVSLYLFFSLFFPFLSFRVFILMECVSLHNNEKPHFRTSKYILDSKLNNGILDILSSICKCFSTLKERLLLRRIGLWLAVSGVLNLLIYLSSTLLMLIAMTMNIYLILSMGIGASCGKVATLFARRRIEDGLCK